MTSLLPRNALRFERSLEHACTMPIEVGEGVAKIATAKELPSPDWVPFLVWEYGLSPLVPFLEHEADALLAGKNWHRIRGTPLSVVLALGIRDVEATLEEAPATGERWFEYQIDPGRVLTPSEHFWLVGLARASSPEGTRLPRVFHGYDVRDFVLGSSLFGDILSDRSGVYEAPRDCVFSFGRSHDASLTIEPTVASASHVRVDESAAYWESSFILGVSHLDGPTHPPIAGFVRIRICASFATYHGTVASGLPWQSIPWADLDGPQLHSHHYDDHA